MKKLCSTNLPLCRYPVMLTACQLQAHIWLVAVNMWLSSALLQLLATLAAGSMARHQPSLSSYQSPPPWREDLFGCWSCQSSWQEEKKKSTFKLLLKSHLNSVSTSALTWCQELLLAYSFNLPTNGCLSQPFRDQNLIKLENVIENSTLDNDLRKKDIIHAC